MVTRRRPRSWLQERLTGNLLGAQHCAGHRVHVNSNPLKHLMNLIPLLFPYFIDKETEVERWVICLKLISSDRARIRVRPSLKLNDLTHGVSEKIEILCTLHSIVFFWLTRNLMIEILGLSWPPYKLPTGWTKVRSQTVPRSLWLCNYCEMLEITAILLSLTSKGKKKSLHDMFKSLTPDSMGYFLPTYFPFDGYVQKKFCKTKTNKSSHQ